jgi:RHS repeat-associated protein
VSGGTFGYDPALRLYQVAGTTTSRFAYDGLNAVAEYDASGNVLKRYVYDPTSGQPVMEYARSGVGSNFHHYYSADERGSIISVTDVTGALIGINRYDEFGIPQSTNTGRFGYTGQMWLSEIGMQYSKARIYAPYLGRFLQTDPIGYGDALNWYAYVRNDPVNLIDPLGLQDTGGVSTLPNGDDSGAIIITASAFGGIAGGNAGGGTGGNGSSANALKQLEEAAKLAAAKNPVKLRPSTKRYLCGKLSAHDFDIPLTYADILAFRQSSDRNALVAEPREAENWIYATGNWRVIPTDGTSRFWVRLYQNDLKPLFSNKTPYSEDALNAGLNGADHRGETQEQLSAELRAYCSGKQ